MARETATPRLRCHPRRTQARAASKPLAKNLEGAALSAPQKFYVLFIPANPVYR
jgi:hypothetical protein